MWASEISHYRSRMWWGKHLSWCRIYKKWYISDCWTWSRYARYDHECPHTRWYDRKTLTRNSGLYGSWSLWNRRNIWCKESQTFSWKRGYCLSLMRNRTSVFFYRHSFGITFSRALLWYDDQVYQCGWYLFCWSKKRFNCTKTRNYHIQWCSHKKSPNHGSGIYSSCTWSWSENRRLSYRHSPLSE